MGFPSWRALKTLQKWRQEAGLGTRHSKDFRSKFGLFCFHGSSRFGRKCLEAQTLLLCKPRVVEKPILHPCVFFSTWVRVMFYSLGATLTISQEVLFCEYGTHQSKASRSHPRAGTTVLGKTPSIKDSWPGLSKMCDI